MGRGQEAREAIENKGGSGIDFSKAFVRLKAGESIRVRVLSNYDYVAYKAHGHFKKGIHTQPCIKVAEERCLLCEASSYNGDLVGSVIDTVKNMKGEEISEWNSLYAKKRVLFAFIDLDEDMIRIFDATKNQAEGLIATIEEYADDLDDMAFTLKRTGEKLDTTYSLNPIMPKKMTEVQEVFDKHEGETITDELFEEALQARTTEEQAKELMTAGFPLKQALDYDITIEAKEEDKVEAIDETEEIDDDDLGF